MYTNTKIITTSNLTPSQTAHINQLLESCRHHDNINGCISLDSSINAITDIPCFYLAYRENTLCSLLTLFIPDEYECEIYAYTSPECRQHHLFTTLLSKALSYINDTSIETILITAEPTSISAKNTADSLRLPLSHSEYMLSYNAKSIPAPQHTLNLNFTQKNDTAAICLTKNNTQIARCHLYIHGTYASIFDFEVTKKNRHKGYGKESLLLIIEYLQKRDITSISLHVSSTNPTALNLYTKYGFTVKEQLDYYRIQMLK